MSTEVEPSNTGRHQSLGLLAMMACVALIMFGMTKTNFQAVDSAGRSQELLCDNKSHQLTFPNFVTAHAWMEQIRWEDAGVAYSITTNLVIGKPFTLSYRCTKPTP